MTTLKPQLIRADTLDLQDHDTPSAQDHARRSQPAPLGAGPAAPHQERSLRHIEAERNAEQEHMGDAWGSYASSGRSSHEGSELLDQDLRMSSEDTRIDDNALDQDGGDDEEGVDGDGTEMLDDRMSSSPSIDDNGRFRLLSVRSVSAPVLVDGPMIDIEEPSVAIFDRSLSHINVAGLVFGTARPLYSTSVNSSEETVAEARSFDLFEPDRDMSAVMSVEDRSVSFQQTPVKQGWPFPSFSSPEEVLEWESKYAPALSLDASPESDWEDVDGSSDIANEEIDPDFVYALHNFIATVEGQANAAKGDAMVLLDDSNSYWWLVRLVKDSSIGYLPAEHIELPVERSARQNKHRNIELCLRHLTDEPSKSKNPLKKAMRRRNAKRVDFGTPIFYEPSEVDPSDDEADPEQDPSQLVGQDQQQVAQQQEGDEVNGYQGQTESDLEEHRAESQYDESNAIESGGDPDGEWSRNSMDQNNMSQRTSRGGTIRNTDSFFEDTAEPRKISLTPNLLREESGNLSGRSSGSTDKSDVFAELDKASPTTEKFNNDRKRKDKKPGMLSGLFKRKDKKIKVDEATGGTVVKHEAEPMSPGTPTTPTGGLSPTASSPTSPKRNSGSSRLTKSPPATILNPTNNTPKSPTETRFTPGPQLLQPSRQAPAPPTNVSPYTQDSSQPMSTDMQPTDTRPVQEFSNTGFVLSPIQPSSTTTMDAVREQPADMPTTAPVPRDSTANMAQSSQQYAGPYRGPSLAVQPETNVAPQNEQVPDLQASNQGASSSGGSTPRTVTPPSPPETTTTRPSDTSTDATTIRTVPQDPEKQEWDSAALAPYFDGRSRQDARDLLLIIGDTTGVKPLPLDHPTMLQFGYHEHQRQLNDMSQRLDALLNGFLARKAARPKQARTAPA